MIVDFDKLGEVIVLNMNSGNGNVNAKMYISDKGKKISCVFTS